MHVHHVFPKKETNILLHVHSKTLCLSLLLSNTSAALPANSGGRIRQQCCHASIEPEVELASPAGFTGVSILVQWKKVVTHHPSLVMSLFTEWFRKTYVQFLCMFEANLLMCYKKKCWRGIWSIMCMIKLGTESQTQVQMDLQLKKEELSYFTKYKQQQQWVTVSNQTDIRSVWLTFSGVKWGLLSIFINSRKIRNYRICCCWSPAQFDLNYSRRQGSWSHRFEWMN